MRRGNVARLPAPPPEASTDVKALHDHIVEITAIANQALQSLQNRVNTIQQTGAKAPPNVTGFTVTGKQGLFHLTWNRIVKADGYVITQASDSAMSQLIGRFHTADGNQCTYQIPVGNVAVTNSFQIYAYTGPQVGNPSNIVTATTAAYGAGEAAPASPPIAPLQPFVAPVRSGPNLP